MDKKTKGSWLIHHTNKLQGVTNQNGYENTFVAGKAGILLSAISADKGVTITNNRLEVLAKAANINTKLELPMLIDVLEKQELIDKSSSGIAVLGVTTGTALQHTSDIFDSLNPNANENASIALAESASISPIFTDDIRDELSDTYKLSSEEFKQLITESEEIGFVDVEKISDDSKLLFNGHLFRRDTTQKIKSVLDSLKPEEQRKLTEITELLRTTACITVENAKAMMGASLFDKIISVGLLDVSVVSNSTEEVGFLTLPSAFAKYSDSMVDDAFDLAKAFLSSITYGMTKSSYTRGQITQVDALLSALIRGESVGPVAAIAQDYKVLELKGVVEVKQGTKTSFYGQARSGPMLTLLKKEVGELALQVIRQGDASEQSLTALPSATVTKFEGPEQTREKVRRKQTTANPKATNDMLSILRTGGKL